MTSSKKTLATLAMGVIGSLMIFAVMTLLLRYAAWSQMHAIGTRYAQGAEVAVWTVAAAFAAIVSAVHFWSTRFTVEMGYQGLLKILGVPLHGFLLGPGDGSVVFKGLVRMQIEKIKSNAINLVRQIFTTGDGIEIEVEGSGIYQIVDAIKAQNIQGESVDDFVTNELITQLRVFISSLKAELGPILAELDNDAKSKQRALELLTKIAQLKNGIVVDGPTRIRDEVNKVIGVFGLELGRAQLKLVHLPEEIEKAAKNILREILESASVPRNWGNKDDAVAIILNTYKTAGVDLKKLPQAELARLVSEAFENVLASEGEGTVAAQRHSFRGQPPAGMIMGGSNG